MKPNWEEILKDRLQLYGHRNWLVIADSAYPAQSRPAIETIVADEEQTTVLERTSAILGGCKHIKPNIYTDKELAFVREEDAPGISSYRERLGSLARGIRSARPSTRRDHREARSRWRVVSSAGSQNQHANSVHIGVFRTGLRILECSGREAASGRDEVRRSTPEGSESNGLDR